MHMCLQVRLEVPIPFLSIRLFVQYSPSLGVAINKMRGKHDLTLDPQVALISGTEGFSSCTCIRLFHCFVTIPHATLN